MKQIGLYLEDNELLRMSAEMQANKKGFNLNSFSNSRDFYNAIREISKETILFLDSDIGEGIRGEESIRPINPIFFDT